MTLKPLIFHPSERTAPKEVIQHLREIDSRFELVWIVDAWVLGKVRPTPLRYLQGGRVLEAALNSVEPDPSDVAYGRLAMQGFAPTAAYHHREADSRIVRDARLRQYNLLNRAEATFAARADETIGGPGERRRAAIARDWGESMAGDAYRRAFKKPVSVSVN